MEQGKETSQLRMAVVRTALPVGLSIVLFASATLFFAIPTVEEMMMASKREMIGELTATVYALLWEYEKRVESGELTRAEAQARAKEEVRGLRYGPEGKDYFWINDMHPRIIMHPYRPDLEGRDVCDFCDPSGKRPFVEFVEAVRENESGYVDYMWQWKDDAAHIVPKLSHVRLFKPWGWVIGTGVYVEDVHAKIAEITHALNTSFGVIFMLLVCVSAYIVWQGLRIETTRSQAVDALRRSERRLNDIIEFLPDATLVIDREDRVIAWNRAIEEMTGVSKEDILGKREYDYALPFYGVRRPIVGNLVLHPNEDIRGEYLSLNEVHTRLQGEAFAPALGSEGRYVLATASPLYDPDGSVAGVIESIRDVTERRMAENALRQERDFNAALIQGSPAFIVMTNEDGTTHLMNNTMLKELGYSLNEVSGHDYLSAFVPVEDHSTVKEAVRTLISASNVEATCVNRVWAKDGRELIVEWHLCMLPDPESESRRFLGVGVDVTARKKAENELQRTRALLTNIVNSMPSILIGVGPDMTVIQWNREAEAVTGLPANRVEGRPLGEVLPDLADDESLIRRAIQELQPLYVRKRPKEVDGRTRYADITIYPLTGGDLVGAVIRIDDATERVRIEEMMIQSEKMLSVGGLAAGMAHEINNPLAGILQNMYVIQNRLSRDLAKNQRVAKECGTTMATIEAYLIKRSVAPMLNAVFESGRRAAQIVDNMLSFSRKGDSSFRASSLTDALDKVVELAQSDFNLKRKYDFRKIEIVREYETGVPDVPCEVSKIQQVFLNILKNGAEAMCAGAEEEKPLAEADGERKPCFHLRVSLRGAMVQVEIEDNGPGMDEETSKRIFEPFFTTKDIGVGTGLGLSVSYFIIVEEHGGQMEVESHPKEGTRFLIRLPLARSVKTNGHEEGL